MMRDFVRPFVQKYLTAMRRRIECQQSKLMAPANRLARDPADWKE